MSELRVIPVAEPVKVPTPVAEKLLAEEDLTLTMMVEGDPGWQYRVVVPIRWERVK